MIDHIWTVLCSRSVVDERSKNVSIQNAIEQLTATGEPVPGQLIPMQLEVVSLRKRPARNANQRQAASRTPRALRQSVWPA